MKTHRSLCAILFFLPMIAFSVVSAPPVHADYCMTYSKPLQQKLNKTMECWPTQQACEAYRMKYQGHYVHKTDFVYSCFPRGSNASSGGTYSSGMKKGSMENAVKQSLVQGIVGGLLNEGLSGPSQSGNAGQGSAALLSPSPMQQKYEQQKLAEQAAREAAFAAHQRQLLQDLKGDIRPGGSNILVLKGLPEPSAAGQLGLLAREGSQAASREPPPIASRDLADDARSDWENRPKQLGSALSLKVPEVPKPIPAENEGKAKRAQEMLNNILGQMTESRQQVEKLDREVKQLEESVSREERKTVEPRNEEKVDDDALRKAREALQRAKENREKAAAELSRLEAEEKTARADLQQATATQP